MDKTDMLLAIEKAEATLARLKKFDAAIAATEDRIERDYKLYLEY